MAYIYRIDFNISPDQMEELEIGASLERVLGYLRTLLPSQTGYVTSRALYSVDHEDQIDLSVESEWERWEDLQAHLESEWAENKVIAEFAPHVARSALDGRIFGEVA
jgi:hypothetical protein